MAYFVWNEIEFMPITYLQCIAFYGKPWIQQTIIASWPPNSWPRAKSQTDPHRRADLEWLASGYRRLADQADLNKGADIVSDPPMSEQHKPTPQPQEAQQQQSKVDE